MDTDFQFLLSQFLLFPCRFQPAAFGLTLRDFRRTRQQTLRTGFPMSHLECATTDGHAKLTGDPDSARGGTPLGPAAGTAALRSNDLQPVIPAPTDTGDPMFRFVPRLNFQIGARYFD
jgi:hypothetical protein